MSRADLLALSTESLVRLANVGLVKRAQKEAASGVVPVLVEDPEGAVTATARDGAVTRLAKGAPLQQTTCTCGATQVCRHRIAAVLAYQAQHGTVVATAPLAWDPGELTDAEVLVACGAAAVARAEALYARGLVATVRPAEVTQVGVAAAPSVALPNATVQFLVPRELAYAKCDCAVGHGCEHVALAVRAFRAAPGGGVVTLRAAGAPLPAQRAPVEDSTRSAITAALGYLVQYGLAGLGAAAALEHARNAAERAGWCWVADGLESIERLAEAYTRQSTRFRLESLALEVGEVVARLRASAAPASPLPAAYVLGSDQASETAMEQVRLLALGARLDADDGRRMARLYFADPDTGTVLVLDKTWLNETRNGADLGQLFASSRMAVVDLARGELVTRAARRRANGELDLGAARGMRSSLLPSSGRWALLPEPLLVRELATHEARLRALPPPCVSPRGLGATIAVFAIARVVEVEVTGDGQAVMGVLEDAAGAQLVVQTEHRQVSPGAVDATTAALHGNPTHVAGELVHGPDGWRMDPVAFLTTQLVVVDLARPVTAGAAPRTPRAEGRLPPSPAAARLAAETREYVGRTLLKGARSTAPLARHLAASARQLVADRLAALVERAGAGHPDAVLDLAVLHQLG